VVSAPQRLSQLPNVPTFKEVGLEPVNRRAYYGIYGPKGLPKEVVDKVYAAVKKATELPEGSGPASSARARRWWPTRRPSSRQIKAEFEVYKAGSWRRELKLE